MIWESQKLPLGTFRVPGPAYLPVLLALLLLVFGVLIRRYKRACRATRRR